MSSIYEFDKIYQKEIYPFDKNGKGEKIQYAINETYALDHKKKPYYPRNLSTGEIYIISKNNKPIFITDNEDKIKFANIQAYAKIRDTIYYRVPDKRMVGNLYIQVMTSIHNLDFTYKAWLDAGLVDKPFHFKQEHTSYKFDKTYRIYERHHHHHHDSSSRHEEMFIFHGDREINVRFDHWGRLQFFVIEPVTRTKKHFDFYHDKTRIYYKLKNGVHKIYYKGKHGLLSDDASYNFLERDKILPFEFGQDLDRKRKIFNYAIDGDSWKFKFDYVNGEIRKFDFDYLWEYKIYYEETPDGQKIYDPHEIVKFEPLDLDCDMGYLKDASGRREIYPKFDGNEFCHLSKEYALDAEKRPYYPTHKTKKLMVLCKLRREPKIIRHLDIVMNDDYDDNSDAIYFLERRYKFAVFRKDYKPPEEEEEEQDDNIKSSVSKGEDPANGNSKPSVSKGEDSVNGNLKPSLSEEEEDHGNLKPSVSKGGGEEENGNLKPSVSKEGEEEEENGNLKPSVSEEGGEEEENGNLKPSVSKEKDHGNLKPSVSEEEEDSVNGNLKPSVSEEEEEDHGNLKPSVSEGEEEDHGNLKPSVSKEEDDNIKPSVKSLSIPANGNLKPSVKSLSDPTNGNIIVISNHLKFLTSILFQKTIIVLIIILVIIFLSYNIFS